MVTEHAPQKFEISVPFNFRTHLEKQLGEFLVGNCRLENFAKIKKQWSTARLGSTAYGFYGQITPDLYPVFAQVEENYKLAAFHIANYQELEKRHLHRNNPIYLSKPRLPKG